MRVSVRRDAIHLPHLHRLHVPKRFATGGDTTLTLSEGGRGSAGSVHKLVPSAPTLSLFSLATTTAHVRDGNQPSSTDARSEASGKRVQELLRPGVQELDWW